MATLRAALHSLLETVDCDLAGIVERLSCLLFSASSASSYSTLFVLLYSPDRSEIVYVNAGHNPPLLLSSDGSLLRLDEGGTVVGLLPSASWREQSIAFHPGDTLITFTDGITEACNHAGEEWTEAGLLRAVLSASENTAQGAVTQIIEQLDTFTGKAPLDDDRTLLVLRRTEKPFSNRSSFSAKSR